MRWASRYQYSLASQILRDAQALERGPNDVLRLGQSSRAHHAACQIAAVRLDDLDTPLPQEL